MDNKVIRLFIFIVLCMGTFSASSPLARPNQETGSLLALQEQGNNTSQPIDQLRQVQLGTEQGQEKEKGQRDGENRQKQEQARAVRGNAKGLITAKVIDRPFRKAIQYTEEKIGHLHIQLQGLKILPKTVQQQWQTVDTYASASLTLVLVSITMLIGLIIERVIRAICQPVHIQLSKNARNDHLTRILAIISTIGLELGYLLIYILVSFVLYILLLPQELHVQIVASSYIIASYYIRALIFIAIIALAPRHSGVRIFPYTDSAARFLFFWILLLCTVEILLVRSALILRKLGSPEEAFLALVGLMIFSTAIILILMIVRSKTRVAQFFCHQDAARTAFMHMQNTLFRYWYIPAILLTCCITCIWELRVLSTGKIHLGRVIMGFLAIPFFGALDIWGNRLFAHLLGQSQPSTANQQAGEQRFSMLKLLQYLQGLYRMLLLIVLTFLLLGLWNLDIPYGQMFTSSILGIIAIVALFYLFWQIFANWVDHKIKQEMPGEDEEADEGGKGGSRMGTLLILLRKFMLIFLVLTAILVILSTIGVNIGPLIASAGILGLAISFGAQSLVSDIFAGIFFLLDDAFRVGDYIDIGSAKGTVDQISLRSVRLRHHRGMVQTIPFGKIDTVTNYSRDYIITKFDLRIKYDTDVEKVRKIIKKIYQALLSDEEFGPKLLGKLKSQGIRQMDDSAMIIRIKFTTPPGEQFILRKEIYRRIQEAFAANNIEFAHRNVTVYLPPEQENSATNNTSAQAAGLAGAAAGSLLGQEEQEQHARPAFKRSP